MDKDFYEVLGLSDKDKELHGEAFEKVLKDKYKKLAKKWHPDRFATKSDDEKKKAEETFKSITEAYDTLNDEQKRNQYDFQQSGGFAGGFSGDPFESFRDFFGGGGWGGWGSRGPSAPRNGDNVSVKIRVSLKEAFNGCKKSFDYYRNAPCHHCNGTGSKTGKTTTCPHCNGTGQERIVQNNGYMQTVRIAPCRHCGGTGVMNDDPCPECSGSGSERIKEHVSFNVPAGTLPGSTFIRGGMGDVIKDGQPGDLIINLDVYNSDGFSFNASGDLVYTNEISVFDALLGKECEVSLLDGTKETVKVPELTPDGKIFRMKAKGFPIYKNGATGSVVMKIKYVYPDKLTSKQRELLKKMKEKK